MTATIFAKAARKLVRPFWRFQAFEVAERDLRAFQGLPVRPGLTCRLAGPDDTPPELTALFGPDLPSFFASRLANGDLVLVHDQASGEFLGYAWGSDRPQPREGVPPFTFDVRPRPGSVYLYDFFVLPEKRRRGALAAAVNALLTRYRDQGLDSAFLLFNASDPAMRAFTSKAGFRISGRIAYRRLFWRVTTDLAALARTTRNMDVDALSPSSGALTWRNDAHRTHS